MITTDCEKTFDGQNMKARIASIFVLLVVSAAGSFSPILAIKYQRIGVPSWIIFVARYFGSGVILATAFIHLLGESNDSFASPCISEFFKEYLWGSALALMGAFTMFSIEVITQRLMDIKTRKDALLAENSSDNGECENGIICYDRTKNGSLRNSMSLETAAHHSNDLEAGLHPQGSHASGANDLQQEIEEDLSDVSVVSRHKKEAGTLPRKDLASVLESTIDQPTTAEEQTAFQKIFNIFLLEFGIIFHSVFVGLSLAVAGEQFITLFIAISFHQFFEGLGLGARFATAKWPHKMRRFPWYLSLAYSLTTPIGIAAGLGVRHLYSNNDGTSLIVVGVFDGFCSGLLIYSCLIEFMARDFLIDADLREAKLGWLVLAYGMFLLGTVFMALVGKWA